MIVISANENLVETLRLVVKNNEPLFLDEKNFNNQPNAGVAVNTINATAFLVNQLEKCEPKTRKWLVLVSKEWEKTVLDAIADISRILMSQNRKNDLKNDKAGILVIKKDKSDGDLDFLCQCIASVREKWITEWTNNYTKCKNMGESRARTEHLAKLEQWISPAQFNCDIAFIDEPDILQKIQKFADGHAISITDAPSEDSSNCFTKPPALHWTNYPRDADVQISFKFNFPFGTITDPLFREWIALAKDSNLWEYEYEWTNGLFIRQQLVKIALVRTPSNVIEITGRIDKEEAIEEDKEESKLEKKGDDVFKGFEPLRRVWPYFAKVFQTFLNAVDSLKTLPYTLNLVLIGQLFFNSPPGARQINSRSLDAIQSLSAIQRAKVVRFKVQDEPEQVYSLCLEQTFPGYRPIQLRDFRPENVGKTRTPSTDNPPIAKITFNLDSQPTDIESFNALNEHFGTTKRVLTQTSSSSALFGERERISSNLLQMDRTLNTQKNRDRRVSFGAIQAIPPMHTNTKVISPIASTSANSFPLSSKKNDSKNCSDSEVDKNLSHSTASSRDIKEIHSIKFHQANDSDDEFVQTYTVVNEYIDKILQKAMDDVLIEN